MMFSREFASRFHASDDEESALKRFLFDKNTASSTAKTTTVKTTTSKYDAEEMREINLKIESRRIKAYKNYEESCNIRGKFKVRSCPKLDECYAKNKLKFVPLASTVNATSPASPTTTARGRVEVSTKPGSGTIKSIFPKIERAFVERALAARFLRTIEDDDEDQDDSNDSAEYDVVLKRFLFGDKTTTTTTARTTTVPISKGILIQDHIFTHQKMALGLN